MASFRKRGDYQWQARITKKSYPPETKTFDTRTAAEMWARDIESQMDKGGFVSRTEADNTTLKEVLERYLREITPHKKGWLAETNRIKAWQKHPLASVTLARSEVLISQPIGISKETYQSHCLKIQSGSHWQSLVIYLLSLKRNGILE